MDQQQHGCTTTLTSTSARSPGSSGRITVEGRTYTGEPEIFGRRLPAKMERFALPEATEAHSTPQDWQISPRLAKPSAGIADLPPRRLAATVPNSPWNDRGLRNVTLQAVTYSGQTCVDELVIEYQGSTANPGRRLSARIQITVVSRRKSNSELRHLLQNWQTRQLRDCCSGRVVQLSPSAQRNHTSSRIGALPVIIRSTSFGTPV